MTSGLGDRRSVSIRPLHAGDFAWAVPFLDATLGGRMQARRGELVDVLAGPGLVALLDDRPAGLVAWLADAAGTSDARATRSAMSATSAELRVLAVDVAARGCGVGRALVHAAADALRAAGVRRAWLVTTNDNLTALALYQKAGWRLSALRPGAVDESRRTLKPAMPEYGEHGIPLRDELELQIEL